MPRTYPLSLPLRCSHIQGRTHFLFQHVEDGCGAASGAVRVTNPITLGSSGEYSTSTWDCGASKNLLVMLRGVFAIKPTALPLIQLYCWDSGNPSRYLSVQHRSKSPCTSVPRTGRRVKCLTIYLAALRQPFFLALTEFFFFSFKVAFWLFCMLTTRLLNVKRQL